MTANLPKHKLLAVTSSAAVTALPTVVFAILLVPAAAAGTLKLTNAADGSSGTILTNQVEANGNSLYISFEDIGGVMFTSKCYATLAGSGAVAYIWYD